MRAGTSHFDASEANLFPPDFTGTNDAGGWMYLNLNNDSEALQTINAPLILQPGPAALTDGLDAIHGAIATVAHSPR